MDAAVVAGGGLGTLGLLLDVVDRETAAGLLELADDVAPGRVGCEAREDGRASASGKSSWCARRTRFGSRPRCRKPRARARTARASRVRSGHSP